MQQANLSALWDSELIMEAAGLLINPMRWGVALVTPAGRGVEIKSTQPLNGEDTVHSYLLADAKQPGVAFFFSIPARSFVIQKGKTCRMRRLLQLWKEKLSELFD